MTGTVLQLTVLVLTVTAAIPGACENDAQDDVTLMQLHMNVATASDTKMPPKMKNADVPTDADRNIHEVQVPSNVTHTLLVNSKQDDLLNLKRGLSATPEKRTQADLESQEWQMLDLALEKLTSLMQRMRTQHTTAPVISLAQTAGSGAASVCSVLVPVVVLITLLMMSPAQSSQKEKFEMRWYHYFIFVSISMIGPMATDILLPAFPEISSALQTTDYLTSLTMPVNMGVRSVSLVLIGLLSDTFGQKKMMMVSLVLFVGGSIICTTASSIETLFVGRVVQGMGEGADALVQAVVRMLIDDSHVRMQVLSVLTGLQPVFLIFAPLIGSVLTNYFGWRSIFCFLIVCAMVSLMGYALIVPETKDDTPRKPVLEEFATVFGNQESMFLLVPFAFIFAILLSMLCNMSFILEEFGESTIGKGLLMASLPPFVALGAFFTSKVFAGEDQSVFLALRGAMGLQCVLWASMFFLGMIFVNSEWVIMASFWTITFGMGLCTPTLATLFLEPLKNTCGLASGILVGAQFFSGAVLVPFSVGQLQAHGIRSMFMVFLIIHLITQAVFWVGFSVNREKWIEDDAVLSPRSSGAARLLQSKS